MEEEEKHSYTSNRPAPQNELRPLSQLLIKRRLWQTGNSSNCSQKRIEVITNVNFVIRKHYPIANPFKDFPTFNNQLYSKTLPREQYPKKLPNFRPKKSNSVDKRSSVQRASKRLINKSKDLYDETISGWN